MSKIIIKITQKRGYCKDEIPDHKIGIYCNLISPLAELRHSAFSCKKVLRYFGKVRHQSNVRIIQYDWLIVLYIFITFVRIASFLLIKNSCVREELTDVNSPLVRAPTQLTHFSLHLPPLQRPGICVVDNFQRFIFGSLPTSSQERVKQESIFTLTFTLRTIFPRNADDLTFYTS